MLVACRRGERRPHVRGLSSLLKSRKSKAPSAGPTRDPARLPTHTLLSWLGENLSRHFSQDKRRWPDR